MEAEIIVSEDPKFEGITMQVLKATSMRNAQLVSGRAIYDAARIVLRNVRKALALVSKSEYKDYIAQGTLP
jgi:hypothetical protein